MFGKIREILLTQYIGAFLIALLVWKAAIEGVTWLGRTGFWFANHFRSGSVFGVAWGAPFPWDNLVFSAITAALYLLTAYGVARWLYPSATPTTQVDGEPALTLSEAKSEQP